jgi:tetratricopeptide (TPR) repeat protein
MPYLSSLYSYFSYPRFANFLSSRFSQPAAAARNGLLALVFLILFLLPWFNYSADLNPLTSQFFLILRLTSVLAVATGIFFLCGWLPLPRSTAFLPFGIFIAAKAITTATSILPHRSVWGGYSVQADGLVYVGILAVLGLTLLSLHLRPREIRFLLYLFIAQSALLSVAVMEQAIDMGTPFQLVRPPTPLTNSTYFLSYACLLLPLSIAVLTDRWEKARHQIFTVPLLGLQLTLLTVAAFLTLPLEVQRLFIPGEAPDGGSKIVQSVQNSSNAERFTQWRLGWQIGLEYPIFGSGPGTTRAAFYHYLPELRDWDHNVAMDLPHNDLIQQFSQSGVLGLFSYLGLWAGLIALFVKRYGSVPEDLKPYAVGLGAGLVLFLVFNILLFTVVYTGVVAAVWFTLLLAFLAPVRQVWLVRRFSAYHATGALCLCAIVVIGYWGERYALAERYANRAIRSSNLGNYRNAAQYNDRAIALFPFEESYYRMGAGHATYALVAGRSTNSLSEKRQKELHDNALSYAEKAIERNPHIPKQELNYGIIQYILSTPGSAQEDEGLRNIRRGLRRSPWDVTFYQNVIDACIMKGDGQRGMAFLADWQANRPAGYRDLFAKEENRLLTSLAPSSSPAVGQSTSGTSVAR